MGSRQMGSRQVGRWAVGRWAVGRRAVGRWVGRRRSREADSPLPWASVKTALGCHSEPFAVIVSEAKSLS